ncbi:MAG: hypothetical protein JSR41_01285 [Proteobacteria bacterium]|nr:hypothetical protein [Pseudomonadota bacterium]
MHEAGVAQRFDGHDLRQRHAAQAAAIAQVEQWVGAAVGNYDGASAIGLAWGYQITEALNVGVGLSGAASGGGTKLGSRVRLGYSW